MPAIYETTFSLRVDARRHVPATPDDYGLFLTGKREDITLVQKKLGLYSGTDAVTQTATFRA